MTTKQADQLIGKRVTVRFPRYANEECTITIERRRVRSAIVEARVDLGNRVGVFNCHEMDLIETK